MKYRLYLCTALLLPLSACEMAPPEGHYNGPLEAGAPAWQASGGSGIVGDREAVMEDDTPPSLPIEPLK